MQHRDADDQAWSDLAIVTGTSYALGADENPAEAEGTWRYRARAVDSSGASGLFSDASDARQGRPHRAASAGPAPHDPPAYADWYADSALVDVADNGDPLLQDGSAGTGVAPSSFDASFLVTSSGDVARTVQDNVGNASSPGTLTVKVDAGAPHVAFTDCPSAPLAIGPATPCTGSQPTPSLAWQGMRAAPSPSPRPRRAPRASRPRWPRTTSATTRRTRAPRATYVTGYEFDGFYGNRISNSGFNRVAAGSVVPLRFSLDGPRRRGDHDTLGLDVLAASQPQLVQVACPRRGAVAQPQDARRDPGARA